MSTQDKIEFPFTIFHAFEVVKVNKSDPIPENMTIEEASEFWDTHSVADYPSHIVQIGYTPEGQITFVAIANDLLAQLEKRAKERGVSIETLVNLWIQEKLVA